MIGSDDRIYGWGVNGNGQVGDGTTTNRLSLVAVSLPSGITLTEIAAGGDFSVAIGGGGPPSDIPETPAAILLPVTAVALAAMAYAVSRARSPMRSARH